MEISLAAQWRLLLGAAVLGAVWGVFWDALRCMRMLFGITAFSSPRILRAQLPLIGAHPPKERKKRSTPFFRFAALFFWDIFFFLFAAVTFRILLFLLANGAFRFFALLGAVLGFGVYRFTLGRGVRTGSEYAVYAVRAVLGYCRFLLLLPLRLLLGRLLHVWFRISAVLYHRAYMRRMLREENGGILPKASVGAALRK